MGFVALPEETFRALVGRGGVPVAPPPPPPQPNLDVEAVRIRFEGIIDQPIMHTPPPPNPPGPRDMRGGTNEKARELLLELLDKEQRRTFEKHGWFDVKVKPGFGTWTRRTVVRAGHCQACRQVHVKDFCVHPLWYRTDPRQYFVVPPGDDDLITILMWLRGNPTHFFATANEYSSSPLCLK